GSLMNLGGIRRAARRLVGSVIRKRGRWVTSLVVVLGIGLVLCSRIPRIPATFPKVLVGIAVLIGLGLIFVVLPTVLVRPHPDLAREQLLKARNDIRTAGIQIVGGTALLAGLVFTNRTLGLNQQGQITDRFTK